jgi:hypothetical protein
MSMTDNISKMLKQKCVYWPSPTNDGYGGFSFADPAELSCRWEEMQQIILDSKGETITSRALVFLSQDVDIDGMLYLGTLASLNLDDANDSSATWDDPRLVAGTYFIKRFQKTPSIDGVGLLRKAYLTPSLSFGGF